MTFLLLSQMKTSEINKALDLGVKYLDQGRYEKAILTFDDVIAIEPSPVLFQLNILFRSAYQLEQPL